MPRSIALARSLSLVVGVAFAALPCIAVAQEPVPPPHVVRTLDECVSIALGRHPSIGVADAGVEAGRARIGQARSGYLPQLAGDWSTDRRKSSFSSRTGGPSDTAGGAVAQPSSFDFHQGSVSLSQTLFDFGQTFAAIRAAQARTDSLEADADTTRQQILLEVKQAYFGLLAARRLSAVAEETVRSNEEQLALARGRNEVGFAPRLDVTRSEVQLASAELDRLSARNNVSVAEVTLQNALGVDGPLVFELEDVLADPHPVPDEQAALTHAYEQRPELRSLLAEQRAAEQDVAQRQRELLPTVRGNATYGGSASEFPLEEEWSVGAAVQVPIFDGGLTLARVSEGKATLHGLHFEQKRLRQQVTLQVRTALLDVQRAAASIRVTERATGQARENLELAEGRYQTGVGNVTELVDAQRARASADADYVSALYDHRIAIATLEQAIGEELPRP